jgi:hypothetical protein
MSKNWFVYKDGIPIEYDSVDKFPENCIGFIYRITNIQTGKFYIGRKSLYSNIKKKLTKKELSELSGPGRKPTKKLVTKESNWKVYMGSSKELLADVKEHGEDKFTREILHICSNKGSCNYLEAREQMDRRVLETEDYYNGQIQCRVHKTHLRLEK